MVAKSLAWTWQKQQLHQRIFPPCLRPCTSYGCFSVCLICHSRFRLHSTILIFKSMLRFIMEIAVKSPAGQWAAARIAAPGLLPGLPLWIKAIPETGNCQRKCTLSFWRRRRRRRSWKILGAKYVEHRHCAATNTSAGKATKFDDGTAGSRSLQLRRCLAEGPVG